MAPRTRQWRPLERPDLKLGLGRRDSRHAERLPLGQARPSADESDRSPQYGHVRSPAADAWRRRVYAVVRRIPPGRVATYGLVGELAGRPRSARIVGNALRHCHDDAVPAHRVVRATGLPAFSDHRTRLRREGVRFIGLRVDMSRQLWTPRLPQRQIRRPSL
ncbi:MAG: hypothetical protein E6J13_11175 [Chloroflexi bacterium]|nr:MAG: hypothetical protein E6J13_11175 [Chloroflexota bacterium]